MSSPSKPTPPAEPRPKPKHVCYCCKQPLLLDDLQRVWPESESLEIPRKSKPQQLVTEVLCSGCKMIQFVQLPSSSGRMFGLPDELTYLLITNQLGDRKSKQSDPVLLFRGLARFWSLAYSMTKPKNAPAPDPSSKEAGDA